MNDRMQILEDLDVLVRMCRSKNDGASLVIEEEEIKQKISELELEIPTRCPVCGSILEEQGADLYCVNPNCRVKLENKCTAVYWAVSIKGITDGWIKKLL